MELWCVLHTKAMELFDKSITKKLFNDNSRESRDSKRSHQITPEQVRLLLFKDCDWRGRKVLYDSATIEKVPAKKDDKPNATCNEVPCIVEVADGFTYVYKGPAADTSLLGEMIFGAVAMTYRGVSMKIHIMEEPKRLMCSKVFCVPVSRRVSPMSRKSKTSSDDLRERTKSVVMPPQRDEDVSLSFTMDRGDSGFYGEGTACSSSSVGSTYDYISMLDAWEGSSTGDYSPSASQGGRPRHPSAASLRRRSLRSVATRFDLGGGAASAHVAGCDSQLYCSSTCSGTTDSLVSAGSATSPRRIKLGLALIFTVTDSAEMEAVRACAQHSAQLHALLARLRLAVVAARPLAAALRRAAGDAARWLSDLMYGPRLQPAWLSLVTCDQPRSANKMADALLGDLCSVLAVGDTKDTNFFISTLLTYVLTYHLGWVTTVSPYDVAAPQNAPESTGDLAPYNALWAQLSDLCGCIGYPPKSARTIISGRNNVKFLKKLLLVLTYFIRCGDVRRNFYRYEEKTGKECKVIKVETNSASSSSSGHKTNSSLSELSMNSSNVNKVRTLTSIEVGMRKTPTLAHLNQTLSTSTEFTERTTGGLKRNPTIMIPLTSSSDTSEQSSITDHTEAAPKVVFVLGDNEKLVGLKNKSSGGKSVKKSSKVHHEPVNFEFPVKKMEVSSNEDCDVGTDPARSAESPSPSRCCSQTLQHSKPIKHSGFKFDFDKYPQIVTNYMKSKNLEILDRHYLGKPGNLKLDNFQFDPTAVPPIQEERCEQCHKRQMEATLQTPTNASELEYMNDVPRQSEPQHAIETVVSEAEVVPQISPKTFVRKRKENTIVINLNKAKEAVVVNEVRPELKQTDRARETEKLGAIKEVVQFPMAQCVESAAAVRAGFDGSLLGGVTDHYVPDLILQGTTAECGSWEAELRRDLELATHLSKSIDAPAQAVAIVGDTHTWQVRVLGAAGGERAAGGMSGRVGALLEALPAMRRARVPAHQCLTYLEGKLRELCVLSKTLADMLMSTDFCDVATLTKSLNIDVNDVPLLLAVAATHTPQVARRYGISYR